MNQRPPRTRKAIVSWALYDFANSAFTTMIVTFVYSAYFAKAIAADEASGESLWFRGVTVSALIIAFLSPFAGAMADRGGHRRKFLLTATVVCILGSFALYFPEPGQVWFALSIFVVANVAFEMANVFYNAFLPDIAPLDRIGRISGYGWALGYIGGLICMILGLVLFVNPDPPLFGLDSGESIRATNILVAVWFALFSIPMFLFVKDRTVDNPPPLGRLAREAWKDLVRVFGDIRKYRQVFRLLLARLIYNDGLITIFIAGAIYAQAVFDFTTEDIIIFGIVLNVAAGLGAFVFGFMDDKLGGKKTIGASLVGLILATGLAVAAPTRFWFWVAGIGVGLLAGPNQSASRSLLGRFTPERHENEFFGFFAFSGKFTAFLGPLLLGELSRIYNMRAGVAVLVVLFIVGGLLLLRVDETEGVATAHREGSADLLG